MALGRRQQTSFRLTPGAPRRRIARAPGWFLIAVLLILGAGAVAQTQDDLTFFRIGTGSTGGTYFPIGALLANAISRPIGARPCEKGGVCGVDGLIAVAVSSSGSVDNIDQIGSGRIDSGLSQTDVAYWGYLGGGTIFDDRGPYTNLRAIAHLYPEAVHVVVGAGSGIETMAELYGSRISLGPIGSGTRVEAIAILKAYGIEIEDIEPFGLTPGAASDMLRNRQIDAMFVVGGHPIRAIKQLAEGLEIRLLPIEGEGRQRLLDRFPFFASSSIPTGTYRGVVLTKTLSVGSLWVVDAGIDDDLVYGITKALWNANNRALLDNGHLKGRQIRLDTALEGLVVPLHEGAARYYEEIGLFE